MQQELCNELPHLIALDQITLKDGIALLGTLEEKIKAGDDGSGGSAEEGFRQFLTQGEAEPHHKATPAQSKGSPKVQ